MNASVIVLLLLCLFWPALLFRYLRASFRVTWQVVFLIILAPVLFMMYLNDLALIHIGNNLWFVLQVFYAVVYVPMFFRLSVLLPLPKKYFLSDLLVISVMGILATWVYFNRQAEWLLAFCLVAVHIIYLTRAAISFYNAVKQYDDTHRWFTQYSFRFAALTILFWLLSIVATVFLQFFQNPDGNIVAMVFTYVLAAYVFIAGYMSLSQFFNKWKPEAQKPKCRNQNSDVLSVEVHRLMKEEKLFADPDFNLEMLAHRLGISVFQTSQLLNQTMNTRFHALVNSYRVNEVKTKLKSNDNRKFTLLAIAFDCGFNSKSSFNRVFKEFTGKTPGEFAGKTD